MQLIACASCAANPTVDVRVIIKASNGAVLRDLARFAQ